MGETDPVLAQLVTELDGAIVAPTRDLLGLDLAEEAADRLDARAGLLAAQLRADDPRLVGQTVIDVLGCLWPHGVTDLQWWRTPVGRLCARSLAGEDVDTITQQEAAWMLGVTRGTVAQMVHRGTLARHPGGGVLRAAVLARLGRVDA